LEPEANYQARQIVGNGVTAIASVASLVPGVGEAAGPVAALSSFLTAMDKSNQEGLSGTEKLGVAVSIIPAAGAMKALKSSKATIQIIKVDAALTTSTTGAIGVAKAAQKTGAPHNPQREQSKKPPDPEKRHLKE
jgi:hypothetical protein